MNVFELAALIKLNKDGYDKGMKEAGILGSDTADKIGKALKTMAKVVAGAMTAAGAAVGGLTVAAVKQYAEYEQLSGGIKKLYGNMGQSLEEYAQSQNKTIEDAKDEWLSMEKIQNQVLNDAQEAYKTAGMSANEYMQTATMFSASLIKSLGGDTQKAAEQTKKAMILMSDNVNTFGTDAEMVQGAIKGLARENYTMLDNLSLGYAGTKAGMAELIKDANAYAKTIGRNTNLQMGNFSDMIDAIQLIQEKQHIAGTTAREATTTIEGSINSMKAAWKNVLTEIGSGSGDLRGAIVSLGETIFGVVDETGKRAGGVINNVIPVVKQSLEGINYLIDEGVSTILDNLPGLLEDVLPDLLKAAKNLVVKVFNTLPKLMQSASKGLHKAGEWVSREVGGITGGVLGGIIKAVGDFVDFISKNVKPVITIIKGIAAAFAAWKIASTVGMAVTAITELVGAIKSAGGAMSALNIAFNANPIGVVATAAAALVGTLSVLVPLIHDTTYNPEEMQRINEMVNTIHDEAKAWQEAGEARKESIASAGAQAEHLKALTSELDNCLDANGRLKDSEKSRADFIIGELNKALGTEYESNQLNAQSITEIKNNIYELIEAQRARAILSAYEQEYSTAVTNSRKAVADLANIEKELAQAEAELEFYIKNNTNANADNAVEVNNLRMKIADLDRARRDALDNVKNYTETIGAYESASISLQEKNYNQAIDTLQNFSAGYGLTADAVKRANAVMSGDVSAWAADILRRYGKTETEIKDIIARLPKDIDISAQMEYIGRQLGDGFNRGSSSAFGKAVKGMIGQVSNMVSSIKDKLQIHSPSRVFEKIGVFTGEGFGIGWEDTFKDVREQMNSDLDFSKSPLKAGVISYDLVGSKTIENSSNAKEMSEIKDLINVLIDKIRNQQIVLDSGAIVGGIIDMIDNALGNRAFDTGRVVVC